MSQYNFIASKKQLENYSYGIHKNSNNFIIDDNYVEIIRDTIFSEISFYTDFPYISEVNYKHGLLDNPEILLEYLKSTLKNQNEIEIISIWLGEKEPIEKRVCHIDNLKSEELQWVLSDKGYKNPRKLKIFKYSK